MGGPHAVSAGPALWAPLTPARNLNYAQQRLLVKVKAAAAHPALTAWLVGNELNGDWNEFVCNPDFEEEIIGHNCTFRDDGRAFLTAIDELCRVVRGEGYLCSTPLAGTEIKLLQFWKNNEGRWPKLAKMAKQYLAAPASTAEVERVFSAAGKMHSVTFASL